MVEFGQIASSETARPIYDGVVAEIALLDHPAFFERPIKVLDIAGGNGVVGNLLKQQCESEYGPLSEREFSALVDYVNLDGDRNSLSASPGRTIHASMTDTHDLLSQESPFDFVLYINPSPDVEFFDQDMFNRNRVPDHIRGAILQAQDAAKVLSQRIVLSSAGLLLRQDGKFVSSGFMSKDTHDGTLSFIKDRGLGLIPKTDSTLDISDALKALFFAVDTGGKVPQGKTLRRISTGYPPYRLMSFGSNGSQNRTHIASEIVREKADLRQAMSFVQAQAQFGSW